MNRMADRAERFVELHREGCFVIPNPWDAGSAKMLAGLGFEALATTSAGYAFSIGRPECGSIPFAQVTGTKFRAERNAPVARSST